MPKKPVTAAAKTAAKKDEPVPSTRPSMFVANPLKPTEAMKVGPLEVDTKGYSGKYHKIGEPKGAEPYALKVVEEDDEAATSNYGHTHHLLNQEHYWTGTKQQFKDQFEKE
jgi:hypothetical protein